MKLEIIREPAQGNAHRTPLLFVHGKWHGAWCWQEHFLPYFASHGYESIAFSLRGHAGSDGKERIGWHTIADYVADVEQVARECQMPPVIIGHSMGGYITQKYLEKNQAPAAVLLTSIPPYGTWSSTWRIFQRHPLMVLKILTSWSLVPPIETVALTREHLFGEDMPEEKVTGYFKRLQEESFRAYLDELGLNLVRPRRIKTPMLVLGAEKDAVISMKAVHDTARAYGTKAEFFPMAHDLMLESGWQIVADRILNWLKEKQI